MAKGSWAKGKYAQAISDRSGFAFPYREMVKEWNGLFVHKSEFEEKHPQLDPVTNVHDAEALYNARPDRIEPLTIEVGNRVFPPIENQKDLRGTGFVGQVTVTTS